MKVWTTVFIFNKQFKIDENHEFKLLSYNEGSIIVEIKYDNKISYQHVILESWFEKFVFFEIINDVPLWKYEFKCNENINIISQILINIYIDENFNLNDFIDKSIALNYLIKTEFNNLPKFVKFNSEKSYLSNIEMHKQPENFKIKLYNYQLRSLNKMINIEKKKDNYIIEYTTEINIGNYQTIKFDPIKNLKSNKKRYFNIISKGGILADEMGLGKTITTLALITANPSVMTDKMSYSSSDDYWKINSKATLILCPSHIANQWRDEAKKSNPSLKVLLILSKKDHEKLYFGDIINSDIIITSHQFLMNFKYYPCLHYRPITASIFNAANRNSKLKEFFTTNIINSEFVDNDVFESIKFNDLPLFEFFSFHRLVLDEGHEIFAGMLSNQSLANYMSTWINSMNANNFWFVSGSPFINFTGLINCIKFLNLNLLDKELNLQIESNNFPINSPIFGQFLHKEYLWNNILKNICIRHRKIDIDNEITFHGYDEKIEWVTFTELENNLYEAKKNKLNVNGLLQLCCHPLILDSCRKVLGNVDIDLSIMQTKLIEYHTKNKNDYMKKIKNLDSSNQAYHMIKKSYETIIIESNYMLSILEKITNTLIDEENEENCIICLDKVVNGSITKCGHIYCADCIRNSLSYKKMCPMCKKPLEINDIYLIKNKIKNENDINPLIEKYGSKLGKLIILIRNIILDDQSRIIIFSQWNNMLELIGKSLAENGIANCFVKGNAFTRNSAIAKFKNGKTLSGEENKVIMLSLKNSASGTNLTEATHIFFVEPIHATHDEAKAIESQAIGRACRIGQKHKVQLYRILVKNTVEEEIYNDIYVESK